MTPQSQGRQSAELPPCIQQDRGRGCSCPRSTFPSPLPLQHAWICPAAAPRNLRSSPGTTGALGPPAATVTEGWNRCNHHSPALAPCLLTFLYLSSDLRNTQSSKPLCNQVSETLHSSGRAWALNKRKKNTQTPNQQSFLTAGKIKALTSRIILGVCSGPRFRKFT